MKTFLAFFLFVAIATAQTFQGSLRGRVTDPAGAAVSNASVTISEEGTSATRRTITSEQGDYVFTAVTPGNYQVTITAPGFKKTEKSNVNVATQSATTVDIQIDLGAVTEQVNVTEQSSALETADASNGQTIDRQKITDLPLFGRNPFLLGKLAQTVVYAGNPKFARMQDHNANAQVSVAGGPLRTNNYLVDGISITDSTNRAVIVPSPEAVQELKVQANTYDAEVSRTGGGTFNTLLRSGTNDIHGSAVGHIRQTDWLANNFFANRAGQKISPQPYRDWGASLGGPIVIPHLYDGRNKTFFFITTEAYRQKDGSTTVLSVPTALERHGDFSQSFARNGSRQIIYDPLTTAPDGTRQPFAGNVIPSSRINSVGQKLASYYPDPNAPTAYYGAQNYNFTGSYPNRGDQTTWKADHEFAPWIRASGSYIHQKTFEVGAPPNIFPNPASPSQTLCCDRKVDATQANATITPGPTTVVALRWGFNRLYSRTTQESAGFDLATLGLPQSLASVTKNPAFPAIEMFDVSSYGGGGASQDVYYSRSFNATVSRFLGRHSLKAGFDFRTIHDFGTPATGPSSFSFADVFTRAKAQSATTGTGTSLATLLLGYPTSGSQSVVTNFNDFLHYYGGFVQDDFRVTPKLTLNYGVRFEYESGIQEVNNKLIVGFNPSIANPLQQNVPGVTVHGQVEYAGVKGNPTQTGNAYSIKPAPRFGFAYSLNDKTVLRGGYGIFWAPSFFNFQNAIGYSQTTSIITSTDGNFTPAATLSNPYPNGLVQPTGNSLAGLSGVGQPVTVFSPSSRSAGYVQQYSFEVQRQVPLGFVITAGIIGSHSLHLLTNGINVDQLNPSYFPLGSALTQSVANPFYRNGGVGSIASAKVSRAQLLLPFPQYTSLNYSAADQGTARYYSVYFRAERRFANGLSLLASYTWSRSMDNLTGVNLGGTNQIASPVGPQNAYDLRGEWSLSAQDVPNHFSAAVIYDLPFGKGKRFLHNNRALDWVVGGWSFNAFGVIQSGYPLAITQNNNNSVIGASYQRPNATGVSPETSGSTDDRINRWLNPAAFTQAGRFTFGNISRFIDVRGPGLFNWDLSLFKSFSIVERIRAQFRFEAINATNTVLFSNPNTSITSPTFGSITAQVNSPRLVQLGLRVSF